MYDFVQVSILPDPVLLLICNFVARILYEAESSSGWGEHELDYILMLRQRQLSVSPSPEEVQDTEWVARDHLQVSVSLCQPCQIKALFG